MQQRGLKLAFGKGSDLLLLGGLGQGCGCSMAFLSNGRRATAELCLSEHTGSKELSGGLGGWYPLGGNDLKVYRVC